MVCVVGHKGAPLYSPENTIESFKKAIEFGVDFIECDIHLSKDKKLVVIHDEKLERTTNGRGYVRDLTLRKLRRLQVLGRSKIPTLREVLELKFPTIIELKSFNISGKYEIYHGLTRETLRIIKTFKSKVIFTSFDKRYLEEIRDYPVEKMLLSSIYPTNLRELQRLNLIGLGIKYTALDSKNIKKAHENNFKISAWTINNEKDIKKILESKVDFITSDNPKLAVEIVRSKV